MEAPRGELLLSLDGFEGPIDLLLVLAREQKVDLARISILQLADQYLAFIEAVRRHDLELAADYLVMAAWLAYLKSRLLLPEAPADDDEPGSEEMAAALAFQLRRLEAMQRAGAELLERPRRGRDVSARGAPEGVEVVTNPVFAVTLYDLLKAYADQRRRSDHRTLHIEASALFTVDEAVKRMERMLGRLPRWTSLTDLVPARLGGLLRRSAVSAHFVAVLELARRGQVRLRQDGGALYVKAAQ